METPFIDPKSIIKLVAHVDDTCNYICDIIVNMSDDIKKMEREGYSKKDIDAKYQEMCAIYRMIWPIAGRCKFLRQKDIKLLIALEEMNGDRGAATGKPLYKTKRRYIKKPKKEVNGNK